MEEKTLSIVIPAYNASKYIKRCLDSFLSVKNISKLEIIIVNDGSKDDTLKIVNEYCIRYPDVFRIIDKQNGNVGSVYNVAFKQCKGKYTKEVDADDWVDGDGLEKLINQLQNCDADVVLNDYRVVDNNGNLTSYVKCINTELSKYNNVYSFKENGTSIAIAMHSTTYKSTLLEKLPEAFDENCYYVDVEYNMFPLCKAENFIALDFPVYNYLFGTSEQSVNVGNFVKNIDQHKTVLFSFIEYYHNYLDKNINVKEMSYSYLITMLSTHFYVCFNNNNKEKAKKDIKEVIDYLRNKQPDLYKRIANSSEKKIKLALFLDKTAYIFYDIVIMFLKMSDLVK